MPIALARRRRLAQFARAEEPSRDSRGRGLMSEELTEAFERYAGDPVEVAIKYERERHP